MICDCERGHNGLGLAIRECDCCLPRGYDPDCPECKGTGERDTGGVYPWGQGIFVPCDCGDIDA